MQEAYNSLGLTHRFMRERVRPGDFCIDATAGRGRDTALLAALAGERGRVLGMDIQPEAVCAARALLKERGLDTVARVVLDSHENIDAYAAPGTVDLIVFNLGWLPGSDHSVSTRPESTLPALEKSLTLLRPGGALSLCVYYGGTGTSDEKEAVLAWAREVDDKQYTALVCDFANRRGAPPIPIFITRDR